MTNKFNWYPQIPELIWWNPHGQALKTLSPSNETRIRKWIFYHLPTNQRQSLIFKCDENICNACNTGTEDDDHVIRCPSHERQKIQQKGFEQLYFYLDSVSHTPKEVTRCIMRGVSS